MLKSAAYVCTRYNILPTDQRFKDLIKDPTSFGWVLAITQDAEKKKWELFQKTLGVLWTAEQFKAKDSDGKAQEQVIIPLAVGINPEITKEARKALESSMYDYMDKDAFKDMNVINDINFFMNNKKDLK